MGVDCLFDAIAAVGWMTAVRCPAALGQALTPREMDVLYAVADGLTNKEVATRLGIRLQNVKNRLTASFVKLGTTTRIGALGRLGWIDARPVAIPAVTSKVALRRESGHLRAGEDVPEPTVNEREEET